MATAEIQATAGTVKATAQMAAAIADSGALASAADTAVGVVVADQVTAMTDFDTFAAAVIAITGDTYSGTTKLFTFGGATGLTHAQWATVGALLNTAMGFFVTSQTDTTTAKAATVAAKGGAAPTADVSVYIGSLSNVSSLDIYDDCIRRIRQVLAGSGLMAVGQGNPRSLG
jgi:hypothetical protein